MWQVKNTTPFETKGYFVRDRDGVEHWVTVVRASFSATADGLVSIADEQKPVRLAPEYTDDTALELKSESDFVPFKTKVDFTVSGRACLPDMHNFKTIIASLSIGSLHKRAAMSGERRLKRHNGRFVIVDDEAASEVDLSWRNCLGGSDVVSRNGGDVTVNPANPVGRGWTEYWSRLPEGAEIALPLIEAADQRIDPTKALPSPFGFGPVQPHWTPRRNYVGTYDDAWHRQRAPLLPEDFDERFYQSAPADQQLDIKGGETITATNLHPDGPFSFRLPQLIFDTATQIGTERHEGRMRLISVGFDTRTKHLDMVWNAHTRCSGRDTDVEGSTVRLRQMAGVAR